VVHHRKFFLGPDQQHRRVLTKNFLFRTMPAVGIHTAEKTGWETNQNYSPFEFLFNETNTPGNGPE